MGSYLPCFCAKNICSCVMECMCTLCLCYCPLHVTLSVNVTRFFSLGCRGGLWCHLIVIILLHTFYLLFWHHKKMWREQASGDTNCPSYICNQKRIKEEYLAVCCRPLPLPTCYFRWPFTHALLESTDTGDELELRRRSHKHNKDLSHLWELSPGMWINTRYIFTHTRVIIATQVFAVVFVWHLLSAN